ncbi:hypothetical protein [Actinomadura sp. NPDC049753]
MNTLDYFLPAAFGGASVLYRRWGAGLAGARWAHAVPIVAVPVGAAP